MNNVSIASIFRSMEVIENVAILSKEGPDCSESSRGIDRAPGGVQGFASVIGATITSVEL